MGEAFHKIGKSHSQANKAHKFSRGQSFMNYYRDIHECLRVVQRRVLLVNPWLYCRLRARLFISAAMNGIEESYKEGIKSSEPSWVCVCVCTYTHVCLHQLFISLESPCREPSTRSQIQIYKASHRCLICFKFSIFQQMREKALQGSPKYFSNSYWL